MLLFQFKQAQNLYKTYGKTLHFLLKSSKAEGTWNQYKSKQNAWKTFCNLWNINPYIKHTQDIYTYFTIWKYETTTNLYTTIDQSVSAIISLYNASTLSDHIDRRKMNFCLV